MPGDSSTQPRSPHPMPLKRSFADFDRPHLSSPRPGTTKRLRIETNEAEQEAKTVPQQPKPLPLKYLYIPLLEDLVDLPPLNPAPKRYCPESVNSFVIQWVESISRLETYRERHCRSVTLLSHSDSNFIPRRLIKSVPNMESRQDIDGFALPLRPASTTSCSYRADTDDNAHTSAYDPSVAPSEIGGATPGSGRKKLVEEPYYRDNNLVANNIYLRTNYEEFPEEITNLISRVRKDRDSPGPSSDQLRQDRNLCDLQMGSAECAVKNYFKNNIFSDPESSDSLKRIDRNPMAKTVVPNVRSELKVSTPSPDILYGYNRIGAFPQQQVQLQSMKNEMAANTQGLIYPFFVIEFKADGPGRTGSLWEATNQCLGGSTSCVNIAESLNRRLRQYKSKEVQLIDSAAFSIAMSGTEARLFVTWKHNELDYHMKNVESFLLQRPDHYVEFRKYVRNILDWGQNKRLKQIRDSLDILLEESRKAASQRAKSRPPPSLDSSVRSKSQKHK